MGCCGTTSADDAEAAAFAQPGEAFEAGDAVEWRRYGGLLEAGIRLAELGAGVAVDELRRLEALRAQCLFDDEYVGLVQALPLRTELVLAGCLLDIRQVHGRQLGRARAPDADAVHILAPAAVGLSPRARDERDRHLVDLAPALDVGAVAVAVAGTDRDVSVTAVRPPHRHTEWR